MRDHSIEHEQQVQSFGPQDEPLWTQTILPNGGLVNIPVSEIWRYRDLLWLLVRRDFVAFYKQTILGPVWFFLQPLLTALMFYVIFGQIAGLSTDGAPQFLFYLIGVTFWSYFSECFIKTSETFSSNAQLFSKVYFPRLIIPLSIVASNFLRFSIQLSLLVLVWIFHVWNGDVFPNRTILLFPLYLLLMASIGLGAGLIFAAATAKYRDLRFLIAFGVQLLMYATPIIYPVGLAPGPWRNLILLNPLASLFESLRYGWLGIGDFSIGSLMWATVFAFSTLVAGILMFNFTERNFIDTV